MANPSKKPTEEQLESAAARVKRGASRDKIAAELGISRRTLNRYLVPYLDAPARPPARPPAAGSSAQAPGQAPARPPVRPGAAPPPASEGEPTMRQELMTSRQIAVDTRDRLIASGEEAEARKWAMEVARYDNLIMRLDKLEDRDALVIPSSQVAVIQRRAFAALDAMAASGPVLCTRCRHDVAADWARTAGDRKAGA